MSAKGRAARSGPTTPNASRNQAGRTREQSDLEPVMNLSEQRCSLMEHQKTERDVMQPSQCSGEPLVISRKRRNRAAQPNGRVGAGRVTSGSVRFTAWSAFIGTSPDPPRQTGRATLAASGFPSAGPSRSSLDDKGCMSVHKFSSTFASTGRLKALTGRMWSTSQAATVTGALHNWHWDPSRRITRGRRSAMPGLSS